MCCSARSARSACIQMASSAPVAAVDPWLCHNLSSLSLCLDSPWLPCVLSLQHSAQTSHSRGPSDLSDEVMPLSELPQTPLEVLPPFMMLMTPCLRLPFPLGPCVIHRQQEGLLERPSLPWTLRLRENGWFRGPQYRWVTLGLNAQFQRLFPHLPSLCKCNPEVGEGPEGSSIQCCY